MNHIGYVAHMQGVYDPAMNQLGSTTLEFNVPVSDDPVNLLVMAQASAICSDDGSGNHTVGVLFKLYDHTDTMRAQGTGLIKLQNPGHGLVPMTYLMASGLDPNTPAKITIETSPNSYGTGGIGGDDFFSIAVVELEQSADRVERKQA